MTTQRLHPLITVVVEKYIMISPKNLREVNYYSKNLHPEFLWHFHNQWEDSSHVS
jgi:hypothetical protein